MRRASLVLAGWSIYVWATRIKNADGDIAVVLYSALLVAAGVLVALAAWKRRRALPWAAGGLAAVTAVIWLVRTPAILVSDYSVGFKVVHTALAIISFALSGWVLREVNVERQREAATATAGLQELADR